MYLQTIQEIRHQFPQECNPNLLACAIKDFLESPDAEEMIRCSSKQGETSKLIQKRLLRKSMLFLGFSVESHYGRDEFLPQQAA